MKQTDYQKSVQVMIAPDVTLDAILHIPDDAQGIILIAHAGITSQHNQHIQFLTGTLNEAGFATLFFDLFTEVEASIDARTRSYRFDISLLAKRVTSAIDWLQNQYLTQQLPIGLFGVNTGAAAVLLASTNRPNLVHAVVSRSGRPDLASDALSSVTAPTLLIVGGNDEPVMEYNQHAMTKLETTKYLEVVPGATHLFEEPEHLRKMAALTQSWFTEHLPESVPLEGES